jgi:hypothetical protein
MIKSRMTRLAKYVPCKRRERHRILVAKEPEGKRLLGRLGMDGKKI